MAFVQEMTCGVWFAYKRPSAEAGPPSASATIGRSPTQDYQLFLAYVLYRIMTKNPFSVFT